MIICLNDYTDGGRVLQTLIPDEEFGCMNPAESSKMIIHQYYDSIYSLIENHME